MHNIKLIPKYRFGNAFSLSSSPMSVLFPQFSALQDPNYDNAYKTDLSTIAGINYADLFLLNTTPSVLNSTLKAGLATATSDNAAIAYTGNLMVRDVLSQVSKAPTTVSPTNGENTGGISENGLNIMNLAGLGLEIFNTAFTALAGEKSEYDGKKGDVARTVDSTYDSILNFVNGLPGGLAISFVMEANKVFGNVANKIGAGTDGMCVCAGTKVFKTNGEIVNIENLKQEDGIIGWCEREKRIKPQTISLLIEPRLKDCVEIILDSGQVLRCSFDHPIYTRNGVFIPAYLLKVGDIVLSTDLNSNIYKSEVVSILPIGILTVYNLQADNDHTYLANGIITHNTTADAILGSSFLLLSPFGLINGFGGKKADTISKNDLAFELVGSSYGGTEATVDDALTYSGKKYGLFSNRARKKANAKIREAKRLLNIMTDIADEATDRFNILLSMAAINGNRYAFNLLGGYNLANIRVGRFGMSLDLLLKSKLIVKALKGKKIKPIYSDWVKTVPKGRLNDNYDLEKAFEVLPFEELENWRKATDEELKHDEYHLRSIYELPNGDYEFLKLGTEETNPEVHLETDTYYSGRNGLKETYDLIFDKDRNRYYYRRKLLKYKEGGIIPTIIELSNPEYIKGFHDGGLINNSTIIELVEPDILDNTNKFQEGGSISPKVRDYYKNYNLDNVTVIRDNNARTENDTIYSPSDEFTVHELWHYLSKNKPNESLKEFYDNLDDRKISELGGNLEFVKRTGDPSDFYNPSELEARLNAAKFMSLGLKYTKEFFKNLRKNENKYGDNMRDLLYMFNDDNLEKLFNISATYKFLEGGSVNVIPEGALHARKHHMDMEGITKKGIPVIDNNGKQQAEIEREEIIFRKSVTEELERLYKIYYDESSSSKDKEDVSLLAGKLLVKEILYNTIDNTENLL